MGVVRVVTDGSDFDFREGIKVVSGQWSVRLGKGAIPESIRHALTVDKRTQEALFRNPTNVLEMI